MQNFITLGQPLLGEKYVAQKKKRKIIPNIVDTSFRSNAQGQRMHSARTNTSQIGVNNIHTYYKKLDLG